MSNSNQSTFPMAPVLAAVVAVRAVAFLLGRWSAPEGEVREVVRYRDRAEGGALREGVGRDRQQAGAHAGAGHTDHAHGPPPSDATEIPSVAAGASRDQLKLAKAVAAAKEALREPTDHHIQEAAHAAAGELEMQLLSDPNALSTALRRFPSLRDPLELELLAAALGRVRDPEVEELALRMAQDNRHPPRQAAALDMLDALDTPKAREVALDVLGRERDPGVRRAALHAVPDPEGASVDDAERVIGSLTQLLESDPDPEARRRAALKLCSWHRTLGELRPVLDHLARDPDVNVRGGCAHGLGVARNRAPEVVNALVQAMTNTGEDLLVRENSYHSLSALSPLPQAAHEAHADFKRELDAIGEAGPSPADDHGHGH